MPTAAVKQLLRLISQPNTLPGRNSEAEGNRLPLPAIFRVLTRLIFQFGLVCLVVAAFHTSLEAQTLQVRIMVRPASSPRVQIEIEAPSEVDTLSFRNSYGSVLGLTRRLRNVEGVDVNSERRAFVQGAPGEFRSLYKVRKFVYEVDLSPPSRLEDMSHVSWLGERRGLLMAADLLPRLGTDGTIFRFSVEVPDEWTIESSLERVGTRGFFTREPDKAVFLVGADLRSAGKQSGSNRLRVTTSGEWPVSNNDLVKIAQKLNEEYGEMTGFGLKPHSTLLLIPFPEPVGRERWTAETRGDTVVLLLGRDAKQKALLNRIGILLSHELFHLWVPNSLQLEGDYDWFFEGFTLYQALVTAVKLGLISFNDYLETMGRVYRSYLANPNRNRLSLIEASESRWTGSSSLVYDKGMLLAFVYDLTLRSKSNCNASLADVYRELFKAQSTGQKNANETIIEILNRLEGSQVFSRNYVQGREELRLESMVSEYGLNVRFTDSGVQLSVQSDLTGDKRRLLRCLGH